MTPPSAIEMERSEHPPRSGAAHVFLVELFRSGKPVFEWSGNTSPEAFTLGLQDEIWSAAAIGDLLEDEHDAAAADWPGPAHGFHEPAARWGAAMLVLGCWAHLNRDAGEEEVANWLSRQMPEPELPAAHVSADICLRHLPELYRMAAARSPDDSLLRELARIACVAPLASAGFPPAEAPALDVLRGDPGAWRVYVDRVIAARDAYRLADPRCEASARATLGVHAAAMAPGLNIFRPHPADPSAQGPEHEHPSR